MGHHNPPFVAVRMHMAANQGPCGMQPMGYRMPYQQPMGFRMPYQQENAVDTTQLRDNHHEERDDKQDIAQDEVE